MQEEVCFRGRADGPKNQEPSQTATSGWDHKRATSRTSRPLPPEQKGRGEAQEDAAGRRLAFRKVAAGVVHVTPDGWWPRINEKLREVAGYEQRGNPRGRLAPLGGGTTFASRPVVTPAAEPASPKLERRSQTKGKASPAPPARLLIADDHPLVREGMRAMLAKEPNMEVVGEAENGQEALELCRSSSPDLILMDLRMPKMDGIEATRKIKEEHPTTSVLVVTTHESPEHLLEAVRAGAAGYILKEATRQQTLTAVRRVLQGESPLNQELAMRLLRRLAAQTDRRAGRPLAEPAIDGEGREQGTPPEGRPAPPLTGRELEVLRTLAQGKTNRQIAQELRISPSTVKVNVQRIILKLEVSDRTQAAVKAAELGLLPDQ